SYYYNNRLTCRSTLVPFLLSNVFSLGAVPAPSAVCCNCLHKARMLSMFNGSNSPAAVPLSFRLTGLAAALALMSGAAWLGTLDLTPPIVKATDAPVMVTIIDEPVRPPPKGEELAPAPEPEVQP